MRAELSGETAEMQRRLQEFNNKLEAESKAQREKEREVGGCVGVWLGGWLSLQAPRELGRGGMLS